jgi:hypothetical protein
MKSHSPGARRFRRAIILELWGTLVLGSGCAGKVPDSILWANPRFFFLSPFACILYSLFFGN